MGYGGSGDMVVGFRTANRRATAERGEVVALAATTMTGIDGFTVPELPEERLRAILREVRP